MSSFERNCAHQMSSFERFAEFGLWYAGPGDAFGTSSASAEKSRAAPTIPNANAEAVPRINFLIISHLPCYLSQRNRRATIQKQSHRKCVPLGRRVRFEPDFVVEG